MIPTLPITVATLPSQLQAQQRHWLCFGLYRSAVMRRKHQTTRHILHCLLRKWQLWLRCRV